MTTITYKDGIIAYDSRITCENIIIYDDYNKCVKDEFGKFFFMCGAISDYENFILHVNNPDKKIRSNIDCRAFVVDFKIIHEYGVHNGKIWREKVPEGSIRAIGSGQDFAMAYMDCGFSAADAVRKTMKFDSATGGVVNEYRIES